MDTNGLGVGEGWGFKVQMFNLVQMFIKCRNTKTRTNSAIEYTRCYEMGYFMLKTVKNVPIQ